MAPGECVLTDDLQVTEGLKVGDKIATSFWPQGIFWTAAAVYNNVVKEDGDKW